MRRGALLAAAGACLLGCAASGATPSAPGAARLTVVATHLNNPRKIFVAGDGSVYVAEAGTGGRAKCLGTGTARTCIGLSGSITRLRGGAQKRVLTGLWSGAHVDGTQAEGPADALLRKGRYYVLLQDATINSRGANTLGADASTAGDLVATKGGHAAPIVLADLAAFEARNNPDHGAGSGARLGNPAIDSDPYAFVPYRGGFAVADAAGNDLLWIDPAGKISVLAVFPTRIEPLSRAVGRRIGAPAAQKTIVTQAVPSSVTVGPDGALYVGELTGVPFEPGTARVWRVEPGEKSTVFASGLTNISDLAFVGNDLLVLELATKGLYGPRSPGALVQLAPSGKRTVLASAGLVYPTGFGIAGHSIYISNYGLYPGSGAGPHGELVRLPLSRG